MSHWLCGQSWAGGPWLWWLLPGVSCCHHPALQALGLALTSSHRWWVRGSTLVCMEESDFCFSHLDKTYLENDSTHMCRIGIPYAAMMGRPVDSWDPHNNCKVTKHWKPSILEPGSESRFLALRWEDWAPDNLSLPQRTPQQLCMLRTGGRLTVRPCHFCPTKVV